MVVDCCYRSESFDKAANAAAVCSREEWNEIEAFRAALSLILQASKITERPVKTPYTMRLS